VLGSQGRRAALRRGPPSLLSPSRPGLQQVNSARHEGPRCLEFAVAGQPGLWDVKEQP